MCKGSPAGLRGAARRTGAMSSRRACLASEGRPGERDRQEPVPMARPSPAWASLGSAAVEQGSGCPERPTPQCLPCPTPGCCPPCGIWGAGEAGPPCILRRLPPLPALGPSLQGTTPRPEPPSSPALAQGVREAARTLVHAPVRSTSRQETQPVGPDGWGCSRALGHSGLCKGWAEAIRVQRKRACPQRHCSPSGLCRCRPPSASLLTGPLWA